MKELFVNSVVVFRNFNYFYDEENKSSLRLNN